MKSSERTPFLAVKLSSDRESRRHKRLHRKSEHRARKSRRHHRCANIPRSARRSASNNKLRSDKPAPAASEAARGKVHRPEFRDPVLLDNFRSEEQTSELQSP